jgi:hypothetical protein
MPHVDSFVRLLPLLLRFTTEHVLMLLHTFIIASSASLIGASLFGKWGHGHLNVVKQRNPEDDKQYARRNILLAMRGGESKETEKSDKIKGPVIGIDLGTTYSCVAVWKNGRVEVCPNEQGNRITPSYVAWDSDGSRLVGDAAKNQATSNPINTVFDVKRLIGRKFSDPSVVKDATLFPFKCTSFLFPQPISNDALLYMHA